MHAAPSVSYPVGRSAWAARASAGAGLCGLAAVAAWSIQSPVFDWRHAAGLAAVFACGSLAARAGQRSAAGVLCWDGTGWQWEEGAHVAAGHPSLVLDLQSRMLLRWDGEGGGRRWLWAERKAKKADWDALRRAVYSRANAPIPASPRGGTEPPARRHA